MENSTKITINEQAQSHFRSSAIWMRAYAIIMIVIVAIFALFVLIVSADTDGKILTAMSNQSGNEFIDVILETFGLIIFGLAAFVVLFGYAAIKLLSAANRFTALSYSATREDLVKGFKSLRMYWMYYGITLIVMMVLGLYFMIRVFSILTAASQS